MKKFLSILLIFLLCFLALTAIGGGIGLIGGFGAPPKELLRDSIFTSYLIPGLVLLIIGGTASVSILLLTKKHKYGLFLSMLVALFIVLFETVEVMVVGSPEGVGRNLQIIYYSTGFLIGMLSFLILRNNNKNI